MTENNKDDKSTENSDDKVKDSEVTPTENSDGESKSSDEAESTSEADKAEENDAKAESKDDADEKKPEEEKSPEAESGKDTSSEDAPADDKSSDESDDQEAEEAKKAAESLVELKKVESAKQEKKPADPPKTIDKNAPIMIEAQSLTKLYGRFAAISDVSFSIPKGQVVAFLGPNGAGKSTTMKILTGFLSPSSGSARIAGLDVTKERIEAARRIGYMPENGPLYLDMTPRSLLQFIGEARGFETFELMERIDRVIRLCHLGSVIEKPIGKLSKGYRQRVGMAQAFLHDPEVLILDEPTSGLDPNQIRYVRDNIIEAGRTKTILLSTHILQEVEAMADRVIFISEGRIVFDGSKDEFVASRETMDEHFYELTRPQFQS